MDYTVEILKYAFWAVMNAAVIVVPMWAVVDSRLLRSIGDWMDRLEKEGV